MLCACAFFASWSLPHLQALSLCGVQYVDAAGLLKANHPGLFLLVGE